MNFNVSFDKGKRVFVCNKQLSGFFLNQLSKRFECTKLNIVARYVDYHDQNCKELFQSISCEVLDPWTGELKVPEDKKLDPVQRMGVRHALERNHSYIAFEQGVGKTPTAIVTMNTCEMPTLILCPPHLVSMWKKEIEAWSVNPVSVEVVSDKSEHQQSFFSQVYICPDSIIDRPAIQNYLGGLPCTFLIVEEAQRFVNWTAKRTKVLFGDGKCMPPNGLVHKFEKVMFLSGTPMPNRPMELHPVLSSCAANTINYMNFPSYGIRYCSGHETEFGWDFKGSSNIEELRGNLRVFMRREEKGSKFAEKTHEVIFFEDRGNRVKDLEKVILRGHTVEEFLGHIESSDFNNQVLGQIAKYRAELSMEKVKIGAERVRKILETTKESVLLLGWHTNAIYKGAEELKTYEPVVVTGRTPIRTRDKALEIFQEGKTRVLIANIQTMVGYNIDRATRVVFFEYSWTPKDNEQAEDRAHRRTSKNKVTVEYLVVTDSLDSYVLQTLLQKKKVINQLIAKRGQK